MFALEPTTGNSQETWMPWLICYCVCCCRNCLFSLQKNSHVALAWHGRTLKSRTSDVSQNDATLSNMRRAQETAYSARQTPLRNASSQLCLNGRNRERYQTNRLMISMIIYGLHVRPYHTAIRIEITKHVCYKIVKPTTYDCYTIVNAI